MVDQPPTAAPIVVNADPRVDQWQAALRLVFVAGGSLAGALGYAGLAGKFSALVLVAGPLAAAAAAVWALVKTGNLASKASTLVQHISDTTVANLK